MDSDKLSETTEIKTSILDELGFDSVVEDVYKLILHNDHLNDMITVVVALMSVCKLSVEKSTEIMMEAHHKGKAVAKTGTKKVMDDMKVQLEEYNLIASVEI